jgi:hypothetical protein
VNSNFQRKIRITDSDKEEERTREPGKERKGEKKNQRSNIELQVCSHCQKPLEIEEVVEVLKA